MIIHVIGLFQDDYLEMDDAALSPPPINKVRLIVSRDTSQFMK